MKDDGYRVAVVGATGAVGVEMLRVLEQRRFPVRELRAIASRRSAGGKVPFGDRHVRVECLDDAHFDDVDIALFSAGGERSRVHGPRAAEAGALVIDNSSAFRMDPAVPLVVPEVNGDDVAGHGGIIANPNCSTILLVVVLAALERNARIARVVCSTYQAVSGSGAAALAELEHQVEEERDGKDPTCAVYPRPIHGNVLPFVQAFSDGGLTTEEWKMVKETHRILGRPDMAISVTCVRVPVRRAHSEAVNVEFERAVDPAEVRSWLADAAGVRVTDGDDPMAFPTPRDAEGGDDVLVGRIRRDPGRERCIDLWLTGDQLRKGAALNAVQIAESAASLEGLGWQESVPRGRIP